MDVAEITRSQAGQRARLLADLAYEVTLDLTRGPEVFGSQSVIRFSCAQPGASSYADLVAQQVHEITLNGAPLPVQAWAHGRIALEGLAADNELRVVADCRYSGNGTGLHRAVDPADQKVYAYTKFEPAYARTVYACFEQPDLKASFTTAVVAPGNWTVLSNQPSAGQEAAGGGRVRWQFEPTPPLPTYLFAVAAGEYQLVRDAHTTPDGRRIPLGLACRASLAPHLEAASILEVTRRGLDYYTQLFGTPYPFAKYDQVFVPEYSVGATENAGCVVFTDQLLFRSGATAAQRDRRAGVILHEMAHMWFGDLVTMKWWDDLWLNESFAEYCATLASAEAMGQADARASFCASRKAWGYAQDQLPSTHPVAADVPTLSEAIANFDGISYAKGASVLAQLVARIGREKFFAGARAYFSRYAFGNATLADWLAVLEDSAGTGLAGWADAWLLSAGPSTLRCDFDTDGAGRFTRFEVAQEPPRQAGGTQPRLRPHKIAIGLYSTTGGTLQRTGQVRADVDGPRTPVPELTGTMRPDLVLPNDDDLSYAVLRFDDRSLDTLLSSIGELADPLARAVCWVSLADMARQAELPLPAFVAAVTRAMPTEPTAASLQTLLASCLELVRTLADPAGARACCQQLAGAAAGLLTAAGPQPAGEAAGTPDGETGGASGERLVAWAQLLAWTAVTAGQLDLVASLLAGTGPAGVAPSTELRWALLRRLAAAGRAGDPEIDAELARDATDSGARNAAACRAAIGDTAHKDAAWEVLAGPADVPADLLRSVAAAFHEPGQADLLAAYLPRYFEELPRMWAGGASHLRAARAAAAFPVTAASPALLGQVDAFLAAAPREPGLARVLAERRDAVRRALASRRLAGRPAGD